jgi:hypothetical protein
MSEWIKKNLRCSEAVPTDSLPSRPLNNTALRYLNIGMSEVLKHSNKMYVLPIVGRPGKIMNKIKIIRDIMSNFIICILS